MSDDETPRRYVTRRTLNELFEEGIPVHYVNADIISVNGVAVEIGTGEEGSWEDAILVCAPPSAAGTAKVCFAACDDCAAPICYRATAPKAAKRVCQRCAKRRGLY